MPPLNAAPLQRPAKMYGRALVAFLALPGVFAGVVPALLAAADPSPGRGRAAGLVLVGLGVCLLLWCVRDFLVAGHGTLAPWDPPRRLVTVGLYRLVRNPMYVSVLTLVLGWALASGSRWLLVYIASLALGFHLRVCLYEEPRLHRQFGDEWTAYRARVGRWFPRLAPRGSGN